MRKKCAIIASPNSMQYLPALQREIKAHDFSASVFSWEDLNRYDIWDKKVYSCIIITDAKNSLAYLQNVVDTYLKTGGNVITLGGPPFSNELYKLQTEYIGIDKVASLMAEGAFEKTVILPLCSEQDLAGFEKDTYNPDSKKYEGKAELSIVKGGITNENCVMYHTDDFVINESFEKNIKIPSGHNAIGFYAKGCPVTKTITVMLIQSDGDMYKTRITPTEDFSYFMLTKREFVFAGNRNEHLRGDQFRTVDFSKVEKIQFGHALSHAYSVAGAHSFYLNELSSASIDLLNDSKLFIDGLYPEFKFYPVTNAVELKSSDNQAYLKSNSFKIPNDLFSHPPRPQATGYNKRRAYRFIPLIEAFDEKGLRCGYGAYMLLHTSACDRKTAHNSGAVACFTTNSTEFYLNGGAYAVAETLAALLSPVCLLEGGSDEYIYLSDQATAVFGASVHIRSSNYLHDYSVRITHGNIEKTYCIEELSPVNTTDGADIRTVSFKEKASEGEVTVELLCRGKVCDILRHKIELYTEKPEQERKFAHIEKGKNEIYLDQKPLRLLGVNYMPTSGVALELPNEFENYVASYSYDPDIFETDLSRVSDTGINAVSIFITYDECISSMNILHLVELCRKKGLYADLSIRPHANPFDFNKAEVREMIEKYRFATNDNVIAYDIAWERYVGTYEECYGNFAGRKSFDEGWRKFLVNRYGGFEQAERAFGCSLVRNEQGEVVGVTDDMLRTDGAHTAMVAVFRRYIDERVAYMHDKAKRFILSLDPNHMVSPRTGDASTIPLVDPGIYGYDYKALSVSMDFMSPESYAITDENESMRQGIFTNIYSRYANPDNVIIWREFGKSIWTGSNFTDNSVSLEFQAEYYRRFFNMLLAGHTAGLFAWWWAGGYRIGENSDFGICAPDGSDRPVTRVFREYADRFLNAPTIKPAAKRIYIDRDLHSDGLLSMYRSVESELFSEIEVGNMVELFDGADGKTSADVELTGVGNLPAIGCVPKYLNGLITSIEITVNGRIIPCESGDTVSLGGADEFTLCVTAINTQKSRWLHHGDVGAVSLSSLEQSSYSFSIPLEKDISYLERVTFKQKLQRNGEDLSFALYASGRASFGERIQLTIK